MNSENKTLRGAAIGAGYFAQFHYEAWSRMAGVDLVAVCDVDRSKAQHMADRYGISEVYEQAADMLDAIRPDFVDIITRPDSHLALVRLAAERKIDVICQKPLAPTWEEAVEIVDLAEQAKIRLMVHENFRFQPWHRELKKLIDQGSIGEHVHTIGCRTRTGDGWPADAYLSRQPYFATMPQLLIYETGVHFVDTYRYLVGEIDGVFASLRKLNPAIAGEDTGLVVFEFADGARGFWDASRFNESNASDPRYTFGEFLVEGDGGSLRVYADGRLTIQPLGRPEHDLLYSHSHRNFGSDCVYATQQHFVNSLRADQAFETDGRQYLRTLRVQQAIYESAASGLPVRGLSAFDHNHAIQKNYD
jgi:predicted dehydrogenase